MNAEGYVTRAELARQIGKGRATLVRWEEAGAIPPAQRASKRRSLYTPAAARAVRIFAGAAQ
jgi:DNA-binding transcriptional MerR regulator